MAEEKAGNLKFYHKLGGILDYFAGLPLAITTLEIIFTMVSTGILYASIDATMTEAQTVAAFTYMMSGILYGSVVIMLFNHISTLYLVIKLHSLSKFARGEHKTLRKLKLCLSLSFVIGFIHVIFDLIQVNPRISEVIEIYDFSWFTLLDLAEVERAMMQQNLVWQGIGLIPILLLIVSYIFLLSHLSPNLRNLDSNNPDNKKIQRWLGIVIIGISIGVVSEIMVVIPNTILMWGLWLVSRTMLYHGLNQTGKWLSGYLPMISNGEYSKKEE